MSSSIGMRIRTLIQEGDWLAVDVGRLADDDDLFEAGLSSHDSVNMMLALEESFEIEFPDRMLNRKTFQRLGSLQAAIGELLAEPVAA